MPVFDMIERLITRRLNFPSGLALRLVSRSAYVGEISKQKTYHAKTAKKKIVYLLSAEKGV